MAIAIWFGQRTLRPLREVLLLAAVAIFCCLNPVWGLLRPFCQRRGSPDTSFLGFGSANRVRSTLHTLRQQIRV